jgi:hypothetical protein
MLEEWKKTWQEFERAPAGERFERMYRRRKSSGSPAARIGMIAAGVLLIAGGIVFLAIPGPGLPILAFGAALIAQQFLFVARALDDVELLLRKLHRKALAFWKKASTAVRAAVVGSAAIIAAGAAYVAYLVLFEN